MIFKLQWLLIRILFWTTLDNTFIANANELCSDDNRKGIDNRESCQQASVKIVSQEPTAKYNGEEVEANYPRGCYMMKNSKNIYFNTHPTGDRNPSARPLCTGNSGILITPHHCSTEFLHFRFDAKCCLTLLEISHVLFIDINISYWQVLPRKCG